MEWKAIEESKPEMGEMARRAKALAERERGER